LFHQRRRVIHFAVTEQPSAAWVSQQLREAFPFETAPRCLLRDRDASCGSEVRQTLSSLAWALTR
jgi:hypothetical protein